MALIIKPKGDKKIFIKGTQIELNEVYTRLVFSCPANGTTLLIASNYFLNKENYLTNNNLHTDIKIGNITSFLIDTETQSLQEAHKYAKREFEEAGYNVEILL